MPTLPFEVYNIYRGKSAGVARGGLLSFLKTQEVEASGETNANQVTGKFKGIFNVFTKTSKSEQTERKNELVANIMQLIEEIRKQKNVEGSKVSVLQLLRQDGREEFRELMVQLGLNHLKVTKHLMDVFAEEFIKRQLLIKQKALVYLYVIDASELASRDILSASDPYLVITFADQSVTTRDEYFQDEENPEFFKSFTFKAIFPGSAVLNVALYDFDDLFGDDLIGETNIDLEDRFYSQFWQAIRNKPVESRALSHPSCAGDQGRVRLWVDIVPDHLKSEYQQYDITPRPPDEFEIRVCVFNATGVKMMDAEGTSDVYFQAYLDDPKAVQATDTHYRCQDGDASFNYRLKLPYKSTKSSSKLLTVKCFDLDFLLRDDFIGQ